MDVRCKRCGSPIPAEDVNLTNALAKCRSCQAVFSFATDLGLDPQTGQPRAARREKVPLPPAIQVDEGLTRLTLTRKWFSPVFFFLAFFCLFWDGFLVVWYGIALFGPSQGGFSILAMIFPIGHVAVGVGLTYYTIAGFFNRTHIQVSKGSFRVHHEPLPWWGKLDLATADLKQLFCEEIVTRGKHGSRNYSYNLNAVLADGRKQKLLTSLPSVDQALYLEQAIEEHLRIEDKPVPGELPRA